MTSARLVLVLVLSHAFSHRGVAAAFEVWHPRNSGPTHQTLTGVAHGNGRFVAVGTAGAIVISTNGADWVARPSGVTRDLNAVTFAGGRFFAGGIGGTLIYSTDGDSWTNVTIPTVYDVDAIGFGTTTNHPLGLLVATVSTNISLGGSFRRTGILTSTNGAYWETNASALGSFSSIASGNDRFVASTLVGGGCALVSDNGRTWFQAGSCLAGAVAFGNTSFLLGRLFQSSSNGWTLATMTSVDGRFWLSPGGISGSYPPRALCFGGSRFVAVAPEYSTIASSPDGTNWTVLRNVTDDGVLNSVAYGDGHYVVVGRGGTILSSEDAVNWVHRGPRSGRRLSDVAPDGDGFVAVGSAGTLAKSTNGLHWEELKAPTTNTLTAVLKSDQYVIVGNNGTILTGRALTNLALQSSINGVSLDSVAFGDGLYVIVGSGTILSSYDLTNWFAQSSGISSHFHDITYGKGRFVAVGAGGTVVVSSDGTNWLIGNSGTTRGLTQVVYGRGRFVAACYAPFGSGALAVTSTDGLTWEVAITSFQSASGSVAYGNGVFLVKSGSNFPGFHASTDGRNWTEYMVRTNFPGADDFAFNSGTFVGVGFYGRAWQSAPVIGLDLIHNGSAQLTVLGPKNSAYRIEGTDNLSATNSWQELTTISTAPYTWTDPDSANQPHRIYRAVLLP